MNNNYYCMFCRQKFASVLEIGRVNIQLEHDLYGTCKSCERAVDWVKQINHELVVEEEKAEKSDPEGYIQT